MTEPALSGPVRYAERGSSWWPVTWGPLFAVAGAAVEALTGPVHTLVWAPAGIVLVGVALLWVQARRRVCSVRLTTDTFYQGREPLPVSQIAEVDDVGVPMGARVLGGGWAVPRRFGGLPLLLTDGSVVVAWAKDPNALRASLRELVR